VLRPGVYPLQNALVELMALVLEEEQHRAVQGLVLLNECVQVGKRTSSCEQGALCVAVHVCTASHGYKCGWAAP
jgi:hypothetical protein